MPGYVDSQEMWLSNCSMATMVDFGTNQKEIKKHCAYDVIKTPNILWIFLQFAQLINYNNAMDHFSELFFFTCVYLDFDIIHFV